MKAGAPARAIDRFFVPALAEIVRTYPELAGEWERQTRERSGMRSSAMFDETIDELIAKQGRLVSLAREIRERIGKNRSDDAVAVA
jgi:hypothetical protein